MTAARERLLLVVVQGLATDDLDPRVTPFLTAQGDGIPNALEVDPAAPRDVVDQLLDGLDVATLREHGIDIDRRSVALRSPTDSDEQVLAALPHRPRGPADVTVLWLRDALGVATRFGLDSAPHRDALRRADDFALRAARVLGCSHRPASCVLLGSTPPEPVLRRVDVAAITQGTMSRHTRRRPRLELAPHRSVVRCASWPDAQRTRTALARHGLVVIPVDDPRHAAHGLGLADILLLAPAGLAMDHAPILAAPPGVLGADRHRHAVLLASPALRGLAGRGPTPRAVGGAVRAARLSEPAHTSEPGDTRRSVRVEDAPDLLESLRSADSSPATSDASTAEPSGVRNDSDACE